MRRFLFVIIFIGGLCGLMAQEPLPLLTPQQMPNPVRFLPPPPDTTSAAFAYDQAGGHSSDIPNALCCSYLY